VLDTSPLDAALSYAARGWLVFPAHSITARKKCTCARTGCGSPGKHPRTVKGVLDATTDAAQIRTWWKRWPEANIGLATGAESGLVVVDLDGDIGRESLLAEAKLDLPETPISLTGGGGEHLLFRHPGARVSNRQNVCPGVDVRGDGGYIIAPPSIHETGTRYEWECSSHPDDVPVADLPGWIVDRICNGAAGSGQISSRRPKDEGPPLPAGPVINGCGWLLSQITNQPAQTEASWTGLLTIAGRLEDGERLAHEWSKQHPGYKPADTDRKLKHAREHLRPVTCNYVRHSLGGEGECADCPHWGRVKSPVVLSRLEQRKIERADLQARQAEQEQASEETDESTATEKAPAQGMRMAEAISIALDLGQQAKRDPGLLVDQQFLTALALVRSWDAANWLRVRELIRSVRVPLADITKRFPAVQLHPDDRATYSADEGAESSIPSNLVGDHLPESPAPTLQVPGGYALRWNGVIREARDQEGGAVEQHLAYAPVLITGRLRDVASHDENLLVSWRWPKQSWQSRIVPRSTLFSTRSIVQLSAIGFPVADDNSRPLVGYLHRFEAMNRPKLPCAAVSSHLGWQGKDGEAGFLAGRTLILPDGEIEDTRLVDNEKPENWSERTIQFRGQDGGDEQICDGYHAAGSLDEWCEALAELQNYPRALLALYAGLAAPLLQILGAPNFVMNWSNRTTTGKTTTLRVAGSCWGYPDERSPATSVQTWGASQVWGERASQVVQSLPLILDDTKKVAVRDQALIGQTIYMVASGRGKGRGSIHGLARTPTWRTILLSSGESPIASYSHDGGSRLRVLEVRGVPFEDQSRESEAAVKRINAAVTTHYGHAGPEFVRYLMQHRDMWPAYRDYVSEHATALGEEVPTPEAGRLAQYAAVVHLAGVIAHQALPLPWDFADPLLPLWYGIAAQVADAAPEIRAMQHVVSWAYSHSHSFHGRLPIDGISRPRPPHAVSGRWDDGEDWRWIGFYPNVLREILRIEGYEYDAVLSGWMDRGWLIAKAGHFTTTQRTGPKGDRSEVVRMVCITREAAEGAHNAL